MSELAKGDVEYRFMRRLADEQLVSIGDLLRESDAKGGVEATIEKPMTVTIPAKSSVLIPVRASFSGLFDDVVVDGAPVAKTFAWEFAPGEASVSTEHGPAEVGTLEVEFSMVPRSCPLNVGRLLSYESENGTIAKVEQRELAMGDGRVLRATQSTGNTRSGDNEPA